MKSISTKLRIGLNIIVLTFLAVSIGNANPDSVGTLSLTDDILRSRAAFAVVDEEIARYLNLEILSEWDYQKLRGPVLLKIRTEIHFQLRQEFDRIVNTVDFGAGSDFGSASRSPSTPQVNKPTLHKKASEIIRNFIAQKHISVIIRSNALIGIGEASTIRRLEGEVRYIYEIINGACISVPLKNLSALVRLPFTTQIWPNAEGNLKLHDSVPHIGADKVHKAPPSGPGVTGEGVRVAVVDGGIDYTHPEFKNPEFKNRIVDARGKVEVGPIGRISRGGDLDHGTHVAGIIGAADNSIGVTGVAPKVQFLDARLSSELSIENRIDALFNGLGWEYGEAIDGIEWAVKNNADVINLSMGWDPWMLGRDGKDMMSELIDEIVDDGIVFVTSAGNEGRKRDSGSILSKQKRSHIFEFDWDFEWDFLRTTVPFGLDHFTVTLVWDPNSTNNDLDLVILDSTGNELVASRGYDWLVKHPTKRGTAVYEQVKIHKAGLKEKTVQYELKVEARNIQGSQDYEVWVSEDGVDFTVVGSNVADPEGTVSVPGYSEKVITVGAVWEDLYNPVFEITSYSSHGPTGTNLMKPEIVAPGHKISSTIDGGGVEESSGTSMAAPHVAGVAALILDAVGKNSRGEWNFSPAEVKSAIVRGAERGSRDIPNTPDNTYGAGLVKADNIIFGGTVPAQGELRFEITPQLLGSRFDGYFLNAENTYPAEGTSSVNIAISWENTARNRNLDIVLKDANGRVLGTSNQTQSNYEKILAPISPIPGLSYHLTVSNRSNHDFTFTGAATHPIKPATRSIPIVSESTSLADIALIIDSSGSMRRSDPTNLRKKAAKQFIDLAAATVQIAVIDLDNIVTIEPFAPLTFADDAGKILLKNAVDRIDSDGDENIAEALQHGFNELLASTVPNAKKAAVLLTDGQDDSDTRQVASDYAGRGWSIYTTGLGSGVNRKLLEEIAAATPKGEYFEASLDNIQTVYNKILAKTTGQSTLASYAGYINKGQQITRKVLIDNTVDQANISCNWQGSTIELVLIDPDGTRITPRDAAANPRIMYRPTETSASYTLENPKPGEWQMQATGTDIPSGGESFYLDVSATSDFSTNLLSLDSSYTVGDTILIGIRVEEKTGDTFTAVSGAMTAAKIVRPDGRVDTLNLYDDGSHNDRAANDGVYANNYRSVDKQGTYLIKVTAKNGFSREIQEQVVVGRIDNVLIDGSTLTPTTGAALKQTPSVISAVISGPAGRINHNSIVLKVDRNTVSHTYDSINQLVSYRPGGLSSGSHNVQLSLRDTSGNAIETTWQFTIGSSVVTTAHPYIYWTNHGTKKIQRSNLDGTDVEDLVTTGLSWPLGIALDVSGGKVYWANSWRGRIQRSNLDGTGVENLVTGLPRPAGIALDVSGGKMYWAEEGGRIRRSNLDGTDVEDLVTGLGTSYGIALDVIGGKIYWTSSTRRKIQRSNLDGTDVEDLVTGLLGPHHIALDVSGGKMYWADIRANKIQRSNLNGTGVEDLVTTGLDGPDGIALDVSNGKIYWSDWGTDKIQRSNLDGTGVEDFVTGIGGAGDIALDVTGDSHDPVVKPRDDHSAHKMYWTDGGRGNIQRSNLDGTQVEDLVTGSIWPLHIAVDVMGRKMYWTNSHTDKIQRANLDGTQIEDLVTRADGLRVPGGIALDVSDGKIYWTDRDGYAPRAGYTSKIQRANLDGTQIEDLVTTGLREPYGIALDVSGGKMYWVDYTAHKIQRANLDGTQVETLVTGLSSPPGIALDVVGRKMYWTNRYGGKIQRANLDGTQVEDLVTGLSGLQGITLDVLGGKMYWADSETDKIQRANLDGTQVEDLVTGLGGPQGIALGIPAQTPPPVVREDVNGDGVVDLQDTAVVRANLGQRGQNDADVNGDGVVDVDDLVLVLAAIEAAAGGAPPFQTQVLRLFTVEEVQQWLAEARLSGDTSPAYLRGIAVLEQILALLTPQETLLLANYPNPFNPETWIPYRLAKPAEVTLTIYAVNGQVVRTLALGHQAAGFYESRSRAAYWDGRNAQGESVASGVYFYTLSAGDFTATRKLLIRK